MLVGKMLLDSVNMNNVKSLPLAVMSTASRKPRMSFYIWAVIFIILTGTLYHQHDTISQRIIQHYGDASDDTRNRTLGFQQIFAIGLPDRTDKRDALTLASSYTGFDITWSPGVKPDDIPKKAIPDKWNETLEGPGALGCWRAHMNVIERVVSEKIQTALILEDDVDWDVSLKTQLQEIAHGMRQLQRTDPSSRSPYGDDWDFFWLGHCRAGPHDNTREFYVIENDPTVVPIRKRHSRWRSGYVFDPVQTEGTRLVFKAYAGMCMFAYAVTYEGARKVLGTMSWNSPSAPVDVSFSAICRGKYVQPFNCYGVYPAALSSHRFAGSKSRDSDLNNKVDTRHEEYTWDIVYSTIQNIPRLISGAPTVLAQWPDDAMAPEMHPAGRSTIQGELITIDSSMMTEAQVVGINDFMVKTE